MNKSRKIIIGAAAGIAVVIAVALAVSRTGQKPAGNMGMAQESLVTVVKADTPQTGEIKSTTSLTGTVEPADVVHVYAKASGDVTAVLVKAGDVVSQGQSFIIHPVKHNIKIFSGHVNR